jgi:aspartate 4-decarboxylase
MKLSTTRAEQKALSKLSPFELKDSLIHLAKESSQNATAQMLNAGRGNPNWIATEPREAFFLFGEFAVAEARRVRDDGILAGMPAKPGSAQRFELFLDMNAKRPGASFLRKVLDYGVKTKGFDKDAWVYELTDAIIGDMYPVPDRMLVHVEQIVHDYLVKEMCAGQPPKGQYDIFAVEGGTAAMCYIFDTLMQNGLLKKGDSVALLVPTFTPYIEICHLERFSFKVVNVEADEMTKDGIHTWHYSDKQLNKLADKKVKLVAVVNPSNPPSVALSAAERKKIVDIVKKKNPNLMVITDDVYGTFVPGFRSLMADLPQNTITVYSYSKNFGCTGWRLGVIAVHQDNIYDKMIARLPESFKKKLDKRYGPLTLQPRKIKFIDRMVADSRNVALNHTAGLSLPQQVQMAFFSLTHLLDDKDAYKHLTMDICHKRRDLLFKGFGAAVLPQEDPLRAWYYVELDFMVWAREKFGQEFVDYMVKNYEPVDFLFRVAELSSVVLMDGGGFGGPPWSVRVSLANLNDEDYAQIGNYMRKAAEQYVEAWQAETKPKPKKG